MELINVIKNMKPGLYWIELQRFSILYKFEKFTSKGFKGKLLGKDKSDSDTHSVGSFSIGLLFLSKQGETLDTLSISLLLEAKNITPVKGEDLPTYINLPFKTPEFDKVMAGATIKE